MHYNIATSASLCASAAVDCATCSRQPIVGSSACRIGRLPSAPATALFLYVRTAMWGRTNSHRGCPCQLALAAPRGGRIGTGAGTSAGATQPQVPCASEEAQGMRAPTTVLPRETFAQQESALQRQRDTERAARGAEATTDHSSGSHHRGVVSARGPLAGWKHCVGPWGRLQCGRMELLCGV
jgi:hypothetical protein